VEISEESQNYRFIPLLDFDAAAAVEYQRLSRSRLRVGSMDLKIAAITLANDATLITRNLSDFRKVLGLNIERLTLWPWSRPVLE